MRIVPIAAMALAIGVAVGWFSRGSRRRMAGDAGAGRRRTSAVGTDEDVSALPFPAGTRIRKLLDVDASNVEVSAELMSALNPAMVDLFEMTNRVFDALIDGVGRWSVEAAADARLHAIAQQMGVTDQELIARLRNDLQGQPPEAQIAWARLSAYRAIKVLVLACQRYWPWAATDLARLRLSTATGYLRLQAEIVGLVKLFLDEPQLAEQWFHIHDKSSGRQFFRDTQAKLRNALAPFELDGVYDIASSGSQHVRLASVVRSVVSTGDQIRLADQDVDPDDPFNFHLTVAHFHKIQGRVIRALGTTLPDIEDEEWRGLFNALATRVNDVWTALEEEYPDELAVSEDAP